MSEWIENELLGKEPVLTDIERILENLKTSRIPRSKLLRLSMLLNDIHQNQYIFSDENVTEKEISDGLKRLLREKLINYDQYKALESKIDGLDLDKLIWDIKSVKVGRGLEFLPRKTSDLMGKLKEWLNEFVAEGAPMLRQKIESVLDELLFRKVISKQEAIDVKEKNNLE